MNEDFVYLTYYQAMAFIFGIDEIKKRNPYFNDTITNYYEEYIVKRTEEIITTYPQIKLKIFPNASKYKISKSLFDYLTKLTSIDVYDKNNALFATPLSQETFDRIFSSPSYRSLIDELEKNLAQQLPKENTHIIKRKK